MLAGITAAPEEISLAAAAGFDYVELSGKRVAAMSEDAFASLERILMRVGVPCLGLNACCPAEVIIAGPGFDPSAVRLYAGRLARRAEALGVRVIGVGSPLSRRLPDGYSAAQAKAEALTFLHIFRERMAGAGVTVCVEALADCYCNFVNTLAEAAELAELAGCKVVLDYYNMERMGEADTDVRPYISFISHAHISDDDGSPNLRSPLKSDKAAVHRARIRGLRDAGYDRTMTLETDVPFNAARATESLRLIRET